MGVSGTGKTTVAEHLAQKVHLPCFDADDFHSDANKLKMKNGIPLTDEDRVEWLENLNQRLISESKLKGAILACSALKERYRQKLIENLEARIIWVVLHGSFDLIYERMQKRKNHYMPASLLRSQFEAMEYPEYGIHVSIDQSPEEIVNSILDVSIT